MLLLFTSCSGLPQQQSGAIGAAVGGLGGAAVGGILAPEGQKGKAAGIGAIGGLMAGYQEGVARGDRDIVSVR